MSNDPNNPSSPPPPAPAAPPPPNFPPPMPYQQQDPRLADAHSKKMLAGLLGIFLGNFGIHKFVLGYTTSGVIMLVVSLVGACPFIFFSGLLVMRIISLVEAIMYLTKTDEQFYETYIANRKEWF